MHNFLNIDAILTKPVPIESSRSGLSIRTGFVKIGAILRTLWAKQKMKKSAFYRMFYGNIDLRFFEWGPISIYLFFNEKANFLS